MMMNVEMLCPNGIYESRNATIAIQAWIDAVISSFFAHVTNTRARLP